MSDSRKVELKVVAIERDLAALDRLVREQLRARDRATETAIRSLDASIERLNERISLLIEERADYATRTETRLLIDALGARLDGMQKSVTDLSSTLIGLRSTLAGQSAGRTTEEQRADRNRTLIFATLGSLFTALNVGVVLFGILHK